MKPRWLAVIVVLVMVSAASGQKASDLYLDVKYDKAAEKTIHGTVVEVQQFDCPVSAAFGHHVVLKTLTGEVVAHTAPVKVMERYGLELKPGDDVEAVGALVKDAAGRPTLVVRDLTRNNENYRFRDKNGKPYW